MSVDHLYSVGAGLGALGRGFQALLVVVAFCVGTFLASAWNHSLDQEAAASMDASGANNSSGVCDPVALFTAKLT